MTPEAARTDALQGIAARLDLRDPNYRAVETLAIRYDEHFDGAALRRLTFSRARLGR